MLREDTKPFDPITQAAFFQSSSEEMSPYSSMKRRSNRKEKRHGKTINGKSTEQVQLEVTTINYKLADIRPLTDTQKKVFENFSSQQHMCLSGYAGTGKTFLAMFLSLRDILYGKKFKKLVIIRSPVASKEIGFLPGDKNQKVKEYELPYKIACDQIFNKSNAYEGLKQKGLIEFHPTSFLRGTTFNDCIVYFDEMQNATYQELLTVITRIGENSKIILSGDYHQCDLVYTREKSGILDILNILRSMNSLQVFDFSKDDIVRSRFIKEFLIREHEYQVEKKSSNEKL